MAVEGASPSTEFRAAAAKACKGAWRPCLHRDKAERRCRSVSAKLRCRGRRCRGHRARRSHGQPSTAALSNGRHCRRSAAEGHRAGAMDGPAAAQPSKAIALEPWTALLPPSRRSRVRREHALHRTRPPEPCRQDAAAAEATHRSRRRTSLRRCYGPPPPGSRLQFTPPEPRPPRTPEPRSLLDATVAVLCSAPALQTSTINSRAAAPPAPRRTTPWPEPPPRPLLTAAALPPLLTSASPPTTPPSFPFSVSRRAPGTKAAGSQANNRTTATSLHPTRARHLSSSTISPLLSSECTRTTGTKGREGIVHQIGAPVHEHSARVSDQENATRTRENVHSRLKRRVNKRCEENPTESRRQEQET